MLDDVADFLDEMKEEEQLKTSFGELLDRSYALRKGGGGPAVGSVKEGVSKDLEDTPIEDAAPSVLPAVPTNPNNPKETSPTAATASPASGSGAGVEECNEGTTADAPLADMGVGTEAIPVDISSPDVKPEGEVPVQGTSDGDVDVEMTPAVPSDEVVPVAGPSVVVAVEPKPDSEEAEMVVEQQKEGIDHEQANDQEQVTHQLVYDDTPAEEAGVKEEPETLEAKSAEEEEKEEATEQYQQSPVAALASPPAAAVVVEEDAGPAAVADDPEKVPLPSVLSDVHLQFLNWHWANLEYGCSAPLSALSAQNWNQDEDYGGFGGPHCMVVGGYDQAFRKIASLLDVRMGTAAVAVKMHEGVDRVEVITATGESLWCDTVVVTVPLGVLKSRSIAFDPPLPPWKLECIDRLGFGDLNKVVLEFPEVFWDDSVDFFGAAKGLTPADRGFCFMWWNFHRFAGAPILAALVSGDSAHSAEKRSDEELKTSAVEILKAMHPGVEVPEPVACTVSRWASEPYSRGSYSYVAVGASGDDYDKLSIPVLRRILFAGEHTIKEHPDTVGGAMLSGLREAARTLEILEDDTRVGAQGAVAVGQAMAELKRKHAAASTDREVPSNKKSRKSSTGAGGGEKKRSGGKKRKGEERNGNGNGKSEGDKEAGGSGEEEEEEEEDGDDLDRRFDGVMGKDVERMHEELRARQTAREATKEVWRCLMMAESRDLRPILERLQTSTDLHSRHTLANCLAVASVKALEALGNDQQCLTVLSIWVSESAAAAVQVALLDQILKALRAMPLEGSLARESGLAGAVKQCTMHGDPDIRKLAGLLSKNWAEGGGAYGQHHQHQQQQHNGGGAGGRGARSGSANGIYSVHGGGGHIASAGNQGYHSGSYAAQDTARESAAPAAPVATKVELDEQALRELEEAEAEMKRKLELAAALAAEAAIAEEQAKAVVVSGQKTVGSFSAYNKAQKDSRKHKRSRDRHGGGGGEEESFDFEKKVKAHISYVLTPYVESGSLKKDKYKAIIEKAGAKVMGKVTEAELAQGRPAYLRKKESITKLAEEYAKSYSSRH